MNTFVVEPKAKYEKKTWAYETPENEKIPAILVINKIDTVPKRKLILLAEFNKRYNLLPVPISARQMMG